MLKKRLILVLKIVLSVGGIWLVFSKIDYQAAKTTVLSADIAWVLLGAVFFILSKGIAAFRLNYFFEALSAKLPRVYNLKLYLLGMFYNLFLPGGVGGDGYKVFLLNKKYKTPTKRLIGSMLVDRASGVTAIGVLMCLLFAFIGGQVVFNDWTIGNYALLALMLIPIGIGFYWLVVKQFFSYLITVFTKTTSLALMVQGTQLITMVCLLLAVGEQDNWLAYLLIFLVSSVMAALPLTIGGAGAREITFLYGATWFGLDENIAVAISVLFYFTQVVVSFFGIYYVFYENKMEEGIAFPEEQNGI